MRRNFRHPTFPAGDNPAGRTRGRQTVAEFWIGDQSTAATTAPSTMAFAPDTTGVTIASSQYVESGPSGAGFRQGPVQHSPPVGSRQQPATQARYSTEFGAVRPSPIDSTVVVYPGSVPRAPNPSRFETPQAPQVPTTSSAVGRYLSPRSQTGAPRSYGDETTRAEEVAAILQDRSRWEAEREQLRQEMEREREQHRRAIEAQKPKHGRSWRRRKLGSRETWNNRRGVGRTSATNSKHDPVVPWLPARRRSSVWKPESEKKNSPSLREDATKKMRGRRTGDDARS